MGRQFNTLEDLVRAVTDGADDTAYVGKYRGKDFYLLAASDDAAFAAVARGLGVEVGAVPLDLIIKATRNILADKPSPDKPADGAGAGRPADERQKWDLENTPVAEVRTIAGGLGIDIGKKSKVDLVAAIREKDGSYRTPDPAQETLRF